MSNSAYDCFLDAELEKYCEDTDDFEPEPEWDGPYPEDELGYYEN